MSPKDKASAPTEMIEREDTVAMVCLVLPSTSHADILMLLQGRYLCSPHRRDGWKTPVTTPAPHTAGLIYPVYIEYEL